MKLLKKNEGLTLIEILVAFGIIAILVPVLMNFIPSAFDESIRTSRKVAVQTSVTALMNKFEQTIKEADNPISDNGYVGNELIINKPSGKIIFTYDQPNQKVICNEYDAEENIIETIEYNYISNLNFIVKTGGYGAYVEVNGTNETAQYKLNNTYYSKNTLSSSTTTELGKCLLTTVIGTAGSSNAIVEEVAKDPGESVTVSVTGTGFNRWYVTTGNVTLSNPSATSVTFTMPSNNVVMIADFQ